MVLKVSLLQIQAREIQRLRETLTQILVDHTGQDFDKLMADTERDNFMSAQEAVDYGLIDKVVTRPEAAKSVEADKEA